MSEGEVTIRPEPYGALGIPKENRYDRQDEQI